MKRMKKKDLYAIALTVVALVGCTAENDLAEAPPVVTPEKAEVPILFSSNRSVATRSDIKGAEAAELLGNKFVVSGYKGSKSATPGSIVFDNYLVEYAENTAYTTQSNTRNWEYVGKGRIKHAIDHGVTQQAIKYWDYSQSQYDFIAWSTGKKEAIYTGAPAEGQVLVSAITPNTATGATGVAYTFQGKAKDLTDCYIADLVTVKKAKYGDDPVTIRFRSLGSKVRIGIYETIPGYSVRDVKFYSAAASNDANATPKLFTTTANDIYTEGTYTIYYPTVDDASKADNNQAHIKFAGTGTQSTKVEFGGLQYTIAEDGEKTAGAVFLGRSSNTASFAGEAEGNYYTQYLPNEFGTNLNLRVNYTLESIDGSGEIIEVKGASAQVPLIYTQWKAGYAYTYLFKISDRTNGHTGKYDPTQPDDTSVNSDPAGLYPITFDAVVVNAEEDKTQETITLVSTPSITTYQQGSNVVNNNEYTTGNDIFVTVNDGGSTQTLTGKAKLYTLPVGTYTEADVVDALSMQEDDAPSGTVKGRSGLVLTEATSTLVAKVEYGVDGNEITLTADQALRFTPDAGKNYAFVYTKTAPTTTTDHYQPVTKAVDAAVNGLYRYNLVAAGSGDVQKGVKYFANGDASTGMITPFLGQGVGNLYLDNAGTTIASGYAVTGTTYYYTVDNGQSYKAAHNVAYADFATATLYTLSGTTYTAKTETAPINGTAYYYNDGTNYIYCVILPQQTTGLYVIDEAEANRVACGASDKAVKGMTYFDKFSKNDGVYYTKVIKVQ
jgi:hypothetical protein